MENFKPRDKHVGPSAAHLGQSHHDKDVLEKAAGVIDQGPSFGTPGAPPDSDQDSIDEIKKAHDHLDREPGVSRPG